MVNLIHLWLCNVMVMFQVFFVIGLAQSTQSNLTVQILTSTGSGTMVNSS